MFLENARVGLAIVMDPIEEKITDLFSAFERDPDLDLLHAALNEVEDVQRRAAAEDRDACRRGLSLLLNFLRELDKQIDPNWDPKEKPTRIIPPPIPDAPDTVNSQLDPAAIADPAVRARYEQELEKNREQVKHYHAQFQLRRLEERAIDDLKLFGERCFKGSSADWREFEAFVDSAGLTDARKRSVRKAVRWRLWPFG